jgi:obg-like ATPase 1
VTHVEGELDPIRDLTIIHEGLCVLVATRDSWPELRLKDEEFVRKHLVNLEATLKRAGKNADKLKVFECEVLQKCLKMLAEDKKDIRTGDWNNKEVEIINTMNFITAKPVVYLVNLSEKDFVRRKNKWLAKIKAWVDQHASAAGAESNNDAYSRPSIIPFSGKLEHFLSSTQDEAEKEKYLKSMAELYGEPDKENKVAEVKSNMPKIITTGYQALQLIYFFTAGPDECRAWTIRKLTKAPQAAGTM